jgi:hypothetical protein
MKCERCGAESATTVDGLCIGCHDWQCPCGFRTWRRPRVEPTAPYKSQHSCAHCEGDESAKCTCLERTERPADPHTDKCPKCGRPYEPMYRREHFCYRCQETAPAEPAPMPRLEAVPRYVCTDHGPNNGPQMALNSQGAWLWAKEAIEAARADLAEARKADAARIAELEAAHRSSAALLADAERRAAAWEAKAGRFLGLRRP